MSLELKYGQLYGFSLGILEGILLWDDINPKLKEKIKEVSEVIKTGYKPEGLDDGML